VIVIIDYDAGNLMSIRNAFARLGSRVRISNEKRDIKESSALVLPGVGAFGCMRRIEPIKKAIMEEIEEGKPFLGLCLGLQLLFEESEESPGIEGLEVFKGKVKRLPNKAGFKVPQLGWNSINIRKRCKLLEGISDGTYFYFANSYAAPLDMKITAATTSYGKEFPSVICRENVFATQFHPEKSGEFGLTLLRNFMDLVS